MLQRFLEVFIPLAVAIDPLGMIPIFIGMTSHLEPAHRRRVTLEAILTALTVCIGFMFLGAAIFRFMGITDADFRIAGGLILLVLSMMDLLTRGKPAVDEREMVGIVPLGMPLIAGPGTLTTVLVLAGNPDLGYSWTLVGLAAVFVILTIAMVYSAGVARYTGMPTLKAFSKLVMVLLAAIAVNFIRTGIAQVMHDAKAP